jgi:hypothetical protein
MIALLALSAAFAADPVDLELAVGATSTVSDPYHYATGALFSAAVAPFRWGALGVTATLPLPVGETPSQSAVSSQLGVDVVRPMVRQHARAEARFTPIATALGDTVRATVGAHLGLGALTALPVPQFDPSVPADPTRHFATTVGAHAEVAGAVGLRLRIEQTSYTQVLDDGPSTHRDLWTGLELTLHPTAWLR